MKMNKYVLGGLAAVLFSPIFFEIPVLWRWAEVKASERFVADNSTEQLTAKSPQQSGIHVYGLSNCGYSKALIQALDRWGFDYIYENMSVEMWQKVAQNNPTKRFTVPVVDVNGTMIVGEGTNIEEVAKVLGEQGKLPLQYIPFRAGTRMIFIFVIELILVLYIWLIYILFAFVRRLSRSMRIS